MRNEGLLRLQPLAGRWELTLSDAWFLEPRDTVLRGQATRDWIDDAFLQLRSVLDGKPLWDSPRTSVALRDRSGRHTRGVGRCWTSSRQRRRPCWRTAPCRRV